MSLRRSTTTLLACCAGLAVAFHSDAQARSRPSSTRLAPPAESGDVDRTLSPYFFVQGGDSALEEKDDFALIGQPTDYLGLNVYWGYFVQAGRDGRLERLPFPTHYPRTSSPWHVLVPQALHWGPRFVRSIYAADALYITEHGAGYDEEISVDGRILDLHRRDCLRTYLREMLDTIEAGVPVKGYFLWSFMDNFEWQDGYQRRFGIVHNDFKTQQRTPKLSAGWYAAVIAANCLQ